MDKPLQVVIFDLDGTLTQIGSIWQFLHEHLGTWDTGEVNADRYFRGEISYDEWARLDTECWRGRSLDEIMTIMNQIPYTNGARETISFLKNEGYRTGIVSAGLSILSRRARNDLGIDLDLANVLHIKDGVMTGEVTVNVDLKGKPKAIEEIAWMLGADMNKVAVVGDNDFDMHPDAALRIAFNPRTEKTKTVAQRIVNSPDLADILPYIQRFPA
jgi:phosphoserine phosphatase